MSSNYTTKLKNKRVISITGDESEVFLNNIITNDIKKKRNKKGDILLLTYSTRKSYKPFFYN